MSGYGRLYECRSELLFVLLCLAIQHTITAFIVDIRNSIHPKYCVISCIATTATTLYQQKEKTRVILYHKPLDVVTTHATGDVLGRRNVYEDLMHRCQTRNNDSSPNDHHLPRNFPAGWHSIGRLDATTTGLLLLTNNGQLVHHVTNHRAATNQNGDNPLQKIYQVVAMGYHHENSPILEQFRRGVDIGHNQTTLPVHSVQILDHPTNTTTRLLVSIIEGRNRQIRKMFHACGSGVMKLSRIAIGGVLSSQVDRLTIDMVPNVGDWCYLSDDQISLSLGWNSDCFPIHENVFPVRKRSNREKSSKTAARHQKIFKKY